MSILQDIQRLQYTDAQAAEDLLLAFVQDVFGLETAAVTLRPLAVSLNSFNGFLTLADGTRLFFKSHVEPGGVIAEYYNTDLMLHAGYPVIRPVYASTEPGRQMLLYEVVEDRSVFDLAWAIEQGEADLMEPLRQAQETADDLLWQVYAATLTWQAAEAHAQAPVHQLFHHRLTQGRLAAFYGPGTAITLPGLGTVPLEQVRGKRWVINGVTFADILDDVIARAIDLLRPAHAGSAVVGHGDAHNGNVFFRQSGEDTPTLVYFDPAFAGQHDPLLDLVKPLYHNVFAMWMYFPQVFAGARDASLTVDGDVLHVTYPADLHPVRAMFQTNKTRRVLVPLLRELRTRGWLRPDWQTYLQAALACCPLLTMNLANGERFPPGVALLGLAHTVEMGARSSDGTSRIESWLDEVEAAL
ncbi:MAG: phosphotransferase [Anaerolineae bacterium]|nr:phosphotransferase [Anaerolineae bacterium]